MDDRGTERPRENDLRNLMMAGWAIRPTGLCILGFPRKRFGNENAEPMSRFLEAFRTMRLPTVDEVHQAVVHWFYTDAATWGTSTVAHLFALLAAALILDRVTSTRPVDSAMFEAVADDLAGNSPIERFEVGDPPLDPSELNTETLTEWEAKPIAQEAQYNDDSPIFEESGGGTPAGTLAGAGLGFDVKATGLGPMLAGGGGVDQGLGTGRNAGRGGAGTGFGLRGSGHRDAVPGVTKASERSVGAALNWFARHQLPDGSWSLALGAPRTCKCSGQVFDADHSAATAMAVLPFLGAGQTHMSEGPYQATVKKGLQWLIKNQKANGDLSQGSHQMYSHGLATIALCEAYGMTQDSQVRYAAQEAVRFIESGQNSRGGWRYKHGTTDGDTSVFGWQIMALHSARLADLEVDDAKVELCRNWLSLVATGDYQGRFGYQPENAPKPSMTAVGLLASQYLGAKRNHPVVQEAMRYILDNPPDLRDRDVYYWYYATLAMHNVPGPEWDTWNRQIRKVLIETQDKPGCAAGSWNPKDDAWGHLGGRMMVTSLSALSLEVYYRYLPMYKTDREDLEAAPKVNDVMPEPRDMDDAER